MALANFFYQLDIYSCIKSFE